MKSNIIPEGDYTDKKKLIGNLVHTENVLKNLSLLTPYLKTQNLKLNRLKFT